jgi:parvulin-like peptidyl-prolyl isomerase
VLAFDQADNAVSEPITVPTGRVIFYVSGKQPSSVPKLDEVRGKVRDELIQVRAVDLAKKKAEEVAAQLKSAPDFAKAAKAAGFEAVTSQGARIGDPEHRQEPGSDAVVACPSAG